MSLDPSFVNNLFVISLVILSICLVVFLAFFIPVLIQITRTLEAIQTIATLLKEYSLTLNTKIQDAGESLSKVKDLAFNLCGSLIDFAISAIKKK